MHFDHSIAQRIEVQQAQDEATLAETLQSSFALSSACALPLLGGYAVRMGVGYPTNRGIGMGLRQEVTASDLERLEAFYTEAGLPPEIELCPFAASSLLGLVAQRGYTVYRFYNIYIRSLSSRERFQPPSSAIHIHQIKDNETLLWAQTVIGTTRTDHPLVTLAQTASYRPGMHCFLAIIQDEVAGGAALSISNGIATLSFMGTVPAFRQRGVQHALIAERLAVAEAHACDLALCSTNPGNQSQRNVLRHGFSLAYTKIFLRKTLSASSAS